MFSVSSLNLEGGLWQSPARTAVSVVTFGRSYSGFVEVKMQRTQRLARGDSNEEGMNARRPTDLNKNMRRASTVIPGAPQVAVQTRVPRQLILAFPKAEASLISVFVNGDLTRSSAASVFSCAPSMPTPRRYWSSIWKGQRAGCIDSGMEGQVKRTEETTLF